MYNSLGTVLAQRRKELGLSQLDVAEALRLRGLPVTNQAVSKWEKGLTQPSARQLLSLCEVLDIEDIRGEFSGGAEGIFSGLDGMGRRMALDYVQLLRESGRYRVERPVFLRTLPLYALPVSAGTGQFLDGEDYELVEVGSEVPEGAHFGVRVAGNSMEPRFHDGQVLWVRQQRSLMTGEIGIFLYDGSAYLKKLIAKQNCMALHSLNPAYEDILISPELPLRVLGKVLEQ